MKPQKALNTQINSEKKKRIKQQVSHFLISNYTIKLLSSKYYGTGIKTTMEQNQEPRNKPKHI